jgi:hypothetical protein
MIPYIRQWKAFHRNQGQSVTTEFSFSGCYGYSCFSSENSLSLQELLLNPKNNAIK